ncbi:glycosyltransferase [Bacillus weihaiensis]|uniref:glycosyltransferase n=1 Tax=Bacillus weihaiensis TaxID=1547283 RepID=UPI0023573432|nr:glycosyltransferase [Bacillus weihaiensis]
MEGKYSLSIIIPIYNTGEYLEDCLDSLLQQDNNDFEIILVDDGSTDNSWSIIEGYIQEYSYISVYRQENKGLSSARNLGLKKAKGRYIWFFDSDDFVERTDCVSLILKELFKYRLDCIILNGSFHVDLLTIWSRNKHNKRIISNHLGSNVSSGIDYLLNMKKNREWRYAVWLYVFKRDLLLENHLYFQEGFLHEDCPYTLCISKKVKFLDENIYKYRIRENSIMTKKITNKNVISYIKDYKLIIHNNNKYNSYNIEYFYYFEIVTILHALEAINHLDTSTKATLENELTELRTLITMRNYQHSNKIIDILTKQMTSKISPSKISYIFSEI